jgi:hypothetical protein
VAERRRRAVAPWLALGLLALCHLAASAASRTAEQPLPDKPTAAPRSPDVPDTHQRLDRIYRKLGLRDDKPVKPRTDDEGCRCKQQEQKPRQRQELTPRVATPAMPAAIGYVLIALIIVAMLIPIYFALRSSYRDPAARAEPEAEDEPERSAERPREAWQVDLSEARRLLQQGRVAEAFAALHRATLLTLERSAHLTLDEATTNWEYVRRLASKPELRATLSAVTLAAEQSVLGRSPPDATHFMKLEQLLLGTSWEAAR